MAHPPQHFPVRKCLHELFSEQAHRTPEAVALSFAGEQLSYAELDRRSTLLASRLHRWGIGPDQLVALLCEPSMELVVGMLGILKAGGAYLPIDARHPPERVRTVLADSGAQVLLTQAAQAEQLLQYPEQLLCLDTEWSEVEREAAVEFEAGVSPAHLAYVIYTSGSTGMPKGVMVTHANVARLLEATQGDFGFDARDTWTLFHSPAFDFSVWEVWGALLSGGRLVVVPYLVSREPEEFRRLLAAERVTVLNQTPSAFRLLSQVEESDGNLAEGLEPLSLRVVVFGGEALEMGNLRGWFERHGDERPRLFNMYGITETTIHVTNRPLKLADLERGTSSVIGEAMLTCRCTFWIGMASGSIGRAWGVVRGRCWGGARLSPTSRSDCREVRPRFLSGEKGARLYRSGDLGRRLPNGDLECLGRVDRQVKIRGFRIELGEIEAALSAQAEVREAVVMVREDTPDDKKLVAYLVVPEGHGLTSLELRKELRESLPEYMVPSTFVFLDGLPLTANGKIDWRALPVPGLEESEDGESVGRARRWKKW